VNLVGVNSFGRVWIASVSEDQDGPACTNVDVWVCSAEFSDRTLLTPPLGTVLALGAVMRLWDDLLDADYGD